MTHTKPLALALLSAGAFLVSGAAYAQESKGWDRTVRVADYLEPAIPHASQEQAALAKLKALEAKTGRKPNILIMVVDDMGYGDPALLAVEKWLARRRPTSIVWRQAA